MPDSYENDTWKMLMDRAKALDACQPACDYFDPKGHLPIKTVMEVFLAEPDNVDHGRWAYWCCMAWAEDTQFCDEFIEGMSLKACRSPGISETQLLKLFRRVRHRVSPAAKEEMRNRFRDKLPNAVMAEDLEN